MKTPEKRISHFGLAEKLGLSVELDYVIRLELRLLWENEGASLPSNGSTTVGSDFPMKGEKRDMLLATDSADRKRFLRWSCVCGCVLPFLTLGCSNLSGSRQTPQPMMGTMREGSYDPYLAHHTASGRSTSAPTHLAEGAATPPNERTASTRLNNSPLPDLNTPALTKPDSEQVVDLGRPVSLPTPSNPRPALLASNDRQSQSRAPELPPLEVKAAATPAPKPVGPSADSIVKEARRKLDTMKTYQVTLKRQERVGGNLLPEEEVLLSVRRNPKAIRLEWPNGSSKGREVIYSATENGGLMHVNMANAIVPMPRISLPPDSPLVMKNSRHPISEAGFDNLVANLEDGLKVKSGPNQVVYAGSLTPPEIGRPCHKLTRLGPNGENWVVYVDQTTGLPTMVQETRGGELMERYLFRDVKPDLQELSVAAAFDVNQRWGSGGFLSRLARGGAADSGRPANSTQR